MQDSTAASDSKELKPPLGYDEEQVQAILDVLLRNAPDEYLEDQ